MVPVSPQNLSLETHELVAVQLSSSHVIWCEPKEEAVVLPNISHHFHPAGFQDHPVIMHENVCSALRAYVECQKGKSTFPSKSTLPLKTEEGQREHQRKKR